MKHKFDVTIGNLSKHERAELLNQINSFNRRLLNYLRAHKKATLSVNGSAVDGDFRELAQERPLTGPDNGNNVYIEFVTFNLGDGDTPVALRDSAAIENFRGSPVLSASDKLEIARLDGAFDQFMSNRAETLRSQVWALSLTTGLSIPEIKGIVDSYFESLPEPKNSNDSIESGG